MGPVCVLSHGEHRPLPPRRIAADDVPLELDRMKHAVDLVGAKLAELSQAVEDRLGEDEAEIFAAQRMMLDDPAMQARLKVRIKSR